MSSMLKDDVIKSCADAYRTASNTTELVAVGELGEKISSLSTEAEGILVKKTDGKVSEIELRGVESLVKNQFNDLFYRFAEKITSDTCFETIPEYAFATMINLTDVDGLISNVVKINGYAFRLCSSLERVTFTSVPTEISSTAFASCSKLTSIQVPWSENELTGAPWGAVNATITYGYTGES